MATAQKRNLAQEGEVRRGQIVEFIRGYIEDHGYSPSMSEVGDAVGLSSPNSVRGHIHKLRDDGVLAITPSVARSIRVIE
jgi:repressor LexA